ncbi:NADH-quinone oxidoreductase subunit C [Pontibacter populi]|uniref:NADH-quinone oxidoreductase subunit C n=1 Tax=Pontibacter populi TaxID=890055 RepID=A0ABV1RR41_9BACT
MTNEALKYILTDWYPDAETVGLQFSEEGSQYLTVSINPTYLHELMATLKANSETSFDYLFCLTGVDWGKELGIVYHLESTTHRHIIVVKVQTEDREKPAFDSVQDIWRTANFHEREVYDFFGIRFTNHPNLKRLFLDVNYEGFPLRKDFEDEVNMIIK